MATMTLQVQAPGGPVVPAPRRHQVGEYDEADWAELVRRYGGLLRATAAGFRLTPAEAEDAAQTTWLQLVRHASGVRDAERLGAWLRVTMRRTCLAMVRQRHRETPVERPFDEVPDAGPTPDACTLRRERDAVLWAAVDGLPSQQRQVVRALFAATEASYEDVAARLSVPLGSIGPTRGRALDRLRIALTRSGLSLRDLT